MREDANMSERESLQVGRTGAAGTTRANMLGVLTVVLFILAYTFLATYLLLPR